MVDIYDEMSSESHHADTRMLALLIILYERLRALFSGVSVADDLYVKNCWIVGRLFQQQKQQKEGTSLSSLLSLPGSKTKRKVTNTSDKD